MGTTESVKRITPLREIRELKGWTQQQVVEMVNRLRRIRNKETRTMQVNHLYRLEKGDHIPRSDVLHDLATVYQVTMESLMDTDIDNEVET